jgi:hypothetical protein
MRQIEIRLAVFLALLGGAALAGQQAPDAPPKVDAAPDTAARAVKPKPLGEAVKKGLAYLAGQQHANGGWGQGGGWRTAGRGGRVEVANVEDPPDVANTCMATLALLRAGNTPKEGPYAKHIARAIDFIGNQIENADKDSLSVTDVKGTQVQTKIGPFVDTFLAALVLAEVKGQLADAGAEKRLAGWLDKTIAKMERNQKEDGSFAKDGWAPVVGQSLASAALNRARQRGARVSDRALDRADQYARANFDGRANTFKGDGTAGVPLYGAASNVAAGQQSVNTLAASKPELAKLAESPSASPAEKTRASSELKRIEKLERVQDQAVNATVQQLGDKRFVQGFGSNGGEEFLSYMNISETLLVKGGPEWEKWDKAVSENLTRVQNQDGSWSGSHCITGRTFCSAAALLVLMADRAPVPVAAKLKEKQAQEKK